MLLLGPLLLEKKKILSHKNLVDTSKSTKNVFLYILCCVEVTAFWA